MDQMVLEFPIMADYCDGGWRKAGYVTHGHHFHEKNLLPFIREISCCVVTPMHQMHRVSYYIYMIWGLYPFKEESWHGYMI